MRVDFLHVICLLMIDVGTSRAEDYVYPKVFSISPHEGSREGATRLVVRGIGFSASANLNSDPNAKIGNKAYLKSNLETVPCDVEDDASHETMIICYTRPMVEDESYFIQVEVDGYLVPFDENCGGYGRSTTCRFIPKWHKTPYIRTCEVESVGENQAIQNSHAPGGLITCSGTIYTAIYGSNNVTNANGRTTTFLRVYVGGMTCELFKETDVFYDLRLTHGDEGTFTCKAKGTFIGHQNVSFILSDAYGRSDINKDLLRASADDTVYVFQTYAEITSVNPQVGSLEGGTKVVIEGHNFDDTKEPVQIFIGGVPCMLMEGTLTAEKLECLAGKPEEKKDIYTGSRGVTVEVWTKTLVGNEAVLDLLANASDYEGPLWSDSAGYKWSYGQHSYVAKFTGIFVAPRRDRYKFTVRGADSCTLYMKCNSTAKDMTKMVWNTQAASSSTHPDQTSGWIELEKDQQCYFESTVKDVAMAASNMYVGVVRATTSLTKDQSNDARNEIQLVDFSAPFQKEKQNITFKNWTSQSGVEEVQEITVEHACIGQGGCAQVGYRLIFDGVKTLFLTADALADTVKEYLRHIFALKDEDITVSLVTVAQVNTYTVTFLDRRGDYPLLAYEEYPPGVVNLNILITEKIRGISERKSFKLAFAGRTTAAIPENPDANAISAALNEMTAPYCPPFLLPDIKSSSVVTTRDYETTRYGEEWGKRKTDRVAFCGRTSLMSPYYVYYAGRTADYSYQRHPRFDAARNRWLCLAHRGLMSKDLWLTGTFKGGSQSIGGTKNFNSPLKTHETEWRYSCVDLMEVIQSRDDLSHVTDAEISVVRFGKLDADHEFYVDALTIGSSKVTDDVEGVLGVRTPPARATGELITKVVVTKNADDPASFDIEVDTVNCGHKIPLIALAYVPIHSSSSDGSVQREDSWDASIEFLSGRIRSGVEPMGGKFDLTIKFNDGATRNITDIPVEISAAEFEQRLEGEVPGFGLAKVERTGSCHARDYKIEWLSNGGDKPLMEVHLENIEGHDDIVATVTTERDGGIHHDPITGEMLRLAYSEPQVEVFINGLPSVCKGDCQFTTSDDRTPVVSGISPTTGSSHAETSLTITGTNLENIEGFQTEITIGDAACEVTDHSATQIACTVGDGKLGTFDVLVNVGGKGFAKKESDVVSLAFTIVGGVSSVNPDSGFNTGGTEVVIAGFGFSATTTFKFHDQPCEVDVLTPTSASCISPPAATGLTSVSVVVEDGPESLGSVSYTYVTPDAIVTSVTPVSSSLLGGEEMVITGENLGTSSGGVKVFLGHEHVCVVLEWSASSIVCDLPRAPHGRYALNVMVVGKGYADTSTNNIPEIVYNLEVTGVSAGTASWNGGTKVSITGNGFTDAETTSAKFGNAICEPESVSDAEMECVLGRLTDHHVVTNDGVHPTYGRGLAWKPTHLDVRVGDVVTWTWDIDGTPGNGFGARVFTTSTRTNSTYDEEGFQSSTTRTRKGSFSYSFTREGTYFYSSGKVDDLTWGKIVMRGSVAVIPWEAKRNELVLKVGSYEATYNKLGRRKREAACAGNIDIVPGCTPAALPDEPNTFAIVSDACYTPTITSISPHQGTSADTVTINGTGFGTADCANKVIIAAGYPDEYECEILSTSSDSIICRPKPQPNTRINMAYYVKVNVNNLGDSMSMIKQDADRRFTLLPSVSGLEPTSGSMAGGTFMNISGSGFPSVKSQISVKVGGYHCTIQTATYFLIQCLTPPSSAATWETVVYINGQLARCSGTCQFQYTSDLTPIVTSIDPAVVKEPDKEIIFGGTGFGDDVNKMRITFGEHSCPVTSLSDTEMKCVISALPAGSHPISVSLDGKGSAKLDGVASNIESPDTVTSMSPRDGSVEGGTTITFTGYGFYADDMKVALNGIDCPIQSNTMTNFQLQCVTQPYTGVAGITVSARAEPFYSMVSLQFEFLPTRTPSLASIEPDEGVAGDVVSITGSLLDPENMIILIGSALCTDMAGDQTMVTCTVGDHSGGTFDVTANVGSLGNAASSLLFKYSFHIETVTPTSGSFGGGDLLTITGRGFGDSIEVSACNSSCLHGEDFPGTSAARDQIICLLSKDISTTFSTDKICDVTGLIDGQTVIGESLYTFAADMTPVVTAVSPARGGTMGGTNIIISGARFDSDLEKVTVTIAGIVCVVSSSTETEIRCTTEARGQSMTSLVQVKISGKGLAANNDVEYQYVDVWSSPYTWGGESPPVEGDFVVVPTGQHLLIDVDTPILKMLLIQGGIVEFDRKDLHLEAENILITDGGIFQIGTREEPFEHKAVVTLHGHLRSRELPIYGTKSIGVRNGSLELHGKHVPITWTELSATADAGSDTLHLKQSVTWAAGDEIVIASTGDFLAQRENEKAIIKSVANDGRSLTLNDGLKWKHISASERFNGFTLETHAEVGLLTRTIVVEGAKHMDWINEVIPACEAGFHTSAFATQTCFQGRFGEEEGSDQFGAVIMIHHRSVDLGLAHARLEYVELTNVGQAFRLGRYPIHFHLLGDVNFQSFVKGCSIHRSFNRGVTIHNTHHLLVQHNVLYDVMGGTVFIEDGIEHGNVIEYNLVVFSKQSTSLQNDDITPASFWVTNPNNTLRHNHAAGGTHFGFWYRIHENPDGPSADPNICQRLHPLQDFRNNTVHTHGWFGLWIFKAYYPRGDGSCGSEDPVPAVFDSLIAWNCEKGAESVNVGAVKYKNFIMAHNEVAGVEIKRIVDVGVRWGQAGLYDSIIVSHAPTLTEGRETRYGIILPLSSLYEVRNTKFVNFNRWGTAAIRATEITGECMDYCGGYEARFTNTSFQDSPNKASFRWPHEMNIRDTDGTLTGTGKHSVVAPYNPSISLTRCPLIKGFDVYHEGVVCPGSVKFHRVAWNLAKPSSLDMKSVFWVTEYGTSEIKYNHFGITHKAGWMGMAIERETYRWSFDGADHLANMSYSATFYDFLEDECVIFGHPLMHKPDRVTTVEGSEQADEMVTCEKNAHGDYYFDPNSMVLYYIVSGRDRQSRRRRSVSSDPSLAPKGIDRKFTFSMSRCYYENCVPPPDITSLPPARATPTVFKVWHSANAWKRNEMGEYVATMEGDGETSSPPDYQDIRIESGAWIIIDQNFPVINKLLIDGVLEIVGANKSLEFLLSATHIVIQGGRLVVGWEDAYFQAKLTIMLRGDVNAAGPGAKGIEVIGGGLDLHGLTKQFPVIHMASALRAGQNKITLVDTPKDWLVGEEIAIAATGLNPWETEIFKIQAVNGNTITLNETAKFEHIAETFKYKDAAGMEKTYDIRAEVGMLTRNIKIIGEMTGSSYSYSYGGRVFITSVGTARGYARIQNVEFYLTGQEGFIEEYNPRFSLAYRSTGLSDSVRPSYVKRNTFHHGFSTAIGIFGAEGIELAENVIYHTVGPAIRVENSAANKLLNNLVMLSRSPTVYRDRFTRNTRWGAAIEVYHYADPILDGNVVVGSEQAGYRIKGHDCSWLMPKPMRPWGYNTARASIQGIWMVEDGYSCTLVNKFRIHNAYDHGIYYLHKKILKISDVLVTDTRFGFTLLMFRPASLLHAFRDKYFTIKNSTVIAVSRPGYCPTLSSESDFIQNSLVVRGKVRDPDDDLARTGIMFPAFLSKFNGVPTMSHTSSLGYPAIGGRTEVINVSFVNFGDRSCSSQHTAFMPNANIEDFLHPIITSGLRFYNSPENTRVFYPRPDLGYIKPDDCVDMECDGLKNALIIDKDGSLLGSPGTVIPEAEFEWDGDPRRGLGDYRIPKTLLTALDGSRIPVADIAPNKGILRANTTETTCIPQPAWQGYKCHGYHHGILVIESMDADTETRRLSPVALLADKYIDLFNGPQDHGWCSGYTCQERLSTFWTIVAFQKTYELHFTGTAPQILRLRMLNADDDMKMIMKVFYTRPQRMDVYVHGKYKPPINTRIVNGRNTTVQPSSDNPDEFKPTLESSVGANYYDRDASTIYVVLSGETHVDIKEAVSVVVMFKMPNVSPEEFFDNGKLVQNLADFLNIPASKIRLVKAVREGTGRSLTQSTGSYEVTIEVGDPPEETLQFETTEESLDVTVNITSNATANATVSMNVTTPSPAIQIDEYDIYNEFEVLMAAAAKLANALQDKSLSGVIGTEIASVSIFDARPPPEPNATESTLQTYDTLKEYYVPFRLRVIQQPQSGSALVHFKPQLQVTGIDVLERDIILGHPANKWHATVSISNGPTGAVLSGDTDAEFLNGIATFENLTATLNGAYLLKIMVTYPEVRDDLYVFTDVFLLEEVTTTQTPDTSAVTIVTFVAGQNSTEPATAKNVGSRSLIYIVFTTIVGTMFLIRLVVALAFEVKSPCSRRQQRSIQTAASERFCPRWPPVSAVVPKRHLFQAVFFPRRPTFRSDLLLSAFASRVTRLWHAPRRRQVGDSSVVVAGERSTEERKPTPEEEIPTSGTSGVTEILNAAKMEVQSQVPTDTVKQDEIAEPQTSVPEPHSPAPDPKPSVSDPPPPATEPSQSAPDGRPPPSNRRASQARTAQKVTDKKTADTGPPSRKNSTRRPSERRQSRKSFS